MLLLLSLCFLCGAAVAAPQPSRSVLYGADNSDIRKCRPDVCAAGAGDARDQYVRYSNLLTGQTDPGTSATSVQKNVGNAQNYANIADDNAAGKEKFNRAVVRPLAQGRHTYTYNTFDKCDNKLDDAKSVTVDARCTFPLKADVGAAQVLGSADQPVLYGAEVLIDGRASVHGDSGKHDTGSDESLTSRGIFSDSDLSFDFCLVKVPENSVYSSTLSTAAGNDYSQHGAHLRQVTLGRADGRDDDTTPNAVLLRPDVSGTYQVQLTVSYKRLDTGATAGMGVYDAAAQYDVGSTVFKHTAAGEERSTNDKGGRCYTSRKRSKNNAPKTPASKTDTGFGDFDAVDPYWKESACPAWAYNAFSECYSTASVEITAYVKCCHTDVNIFPVPSLPGLGSQITTTKKTLLNGYASFKGDSWCLPDNYPPTHVEVQQKTRRYSPYLNNSVISADARLGLSTTANPATATVADAAGCTWPGATNFKATAYHDDGSCVCNQVEYNVDGTTYADKRTVRELGDHSEYVSGMAVTDGAATDGATATNPAALNNFHSLWSIDGTKSTTFGGNNYADVTVRKLRYPEDMNRLTGFETYSGWRNTIIPHYVARASTDAYVTGDIVHDGNKQCYYALAAPTGLSNPETPNEWWECTTGERAGTATPYAPEECTCGNALTGTAATRDDAISQYDIDVFDITTEYAKDQVVYEPMSQKCWRSKKGGNKGHLDVGKALHTVDVAAADANTKSKYKRDGATWVKVGCPADDQLGRVSVGAWFVESDVKRMDAAQEVTIQRKIHKTCVRDALSSHSVLITLGTKVRTLLKSRLVTYDERDEDDAATNKDNLLCRVTLGGTSELIGAFDPAAYPFPDDDLTSDGFWEASAPDTAAANGVTAFVATDAYRGVLASDYATADVREYYSRFYASRGLHFRFADAAASAPSIMLTGNVAAPAPSGCAGTYTVGVELSKDQDAPSFVVGKTYHKNFVVRAADNYCYVSLKDFNIGNTPEITLDGLTIDTVAATNRFKTSVQRANFRAHAEFWKQLPTCTGYMSHEGCPVASDFTTTTSTCDFVPVIVAGAIIAGPGTTQTYKSVAGAEWTGSTDRVLEWSGTVYYRKGDLVSKAHKFYEAILSSRKPSGPDNNDGYGTATAAGTNMKKEYNFNHDPSAVGQEIWWTLRGSAAAAMFDGRKVATGTRTAETAAEAATGEWLRYNRAWHVGTTFAMGEVVTRAIDAFEFAAAGTPDTAGAAQILYKAGSRVRNRAGTACFEVLYDFSKQEDLAGNALTGLAIPGWGKNSVTQYEFVALVSGTCATIGGFAVTAANAAACAANAATNVWSGVQHITLNTVENLVVGARIKFTPDDPLVTLKAGGDLVASGTFFWVKTLDVAGKQISLSATQDGNVLTTLEDGAVADRFTLTTHAVGQYIHRFDATHTANDASMYLKGDVVRVRALAAQKGAGVAAAGTDLSHGTCYEALDDIPKAVTVQDVRNLKDHTKARVLELPLVITTTAHNFAAGKQVQMSNAGVGGGDNAQFLGRTWKVAPSPSMGSTSYVGSTSLSFALEGTVSMDGTDGLTVSQGLAATTHAMPKNFVQGSATPTVVFRALADTDLWKPVPCLYEGQLSSTCKTDGTCALFSRVQCDERCYRSVGAVAGDDPLLKSDRMDLASTNPTVATAAADIADANGIETKLKYDRGVAYADIVWATAACDYMPTVYFQPQLATFGSVALSTTVDDATHFPAAAFTDYLDLKQESWSVLVAPVDYTYRGGYASATRIHSGATAAGECQTSAVDATETADEQAGCTDPKVWVPEELAPFGLDQKYAPHGSPETRSTVSHEGRCYEFTGNNMKNVQGNTLTAGNTLDGGDRPNSFSFPAYGTCVCTGVLATAPTLTGVNGKATCEAVATCTYTAADAAWTSGETDWVEVTCDQTTFLKGSSPAGVAAGSADTAVAAENAHFGATIHTGAWSASGSYARGAVVAYGAQCYRCKESCSAGDAPVTALSGIPDSPTTTSAQWELGATCLSTYTRPTWGKDALATYDFATWPALKADSKRGRTGTGNDVDLSQDVLDGTRNPYKARPFRQDTGIAEAAGYHFTPNNEGEYQLQVQMMGNCGTTTDTIRVRARCFPLVARPALFLPSTQLNGATTGRNGASKRGRNIALGFTPDTRHLEVSTDLAGAGWEDHVDLVAGSRAYRPHGDYMVGFNGAAVTLAVGEPTAANAQAGTKVVSKATPFIEANANPAYGTCVCAGVGVTAPTLTGVNDKVTCEAVLTCAYTAAAGVSKIGDSVFNTKSAIGPLTPKTDHTKDAAAKENTFCFFGHMSSITYPQVAATNSGFVGAASGTVTLLWQSKIAGGKLASFYLRPGVRFPEGYGVSTDDSAAVKLSMQKVRYHWTMTRTAPLTEAQTTAIGYEETAECRTWYGINDKFAGAKGSANEGASTDAKVHLTIAGTYTFTMHAFDACVKSADSVIVVEFRCDQSQIGTASGKCTVDSPLTGATRIADRNNCEAQATGAAHTLETCFGVKKSASATLASAADRACKWAFPTLPVATVHLGAQAVRHPTSSANPSPTANVPLGMCTNGVADACVKTAAVVETACTSPCSWAAGDTTDTDNALGDETQIKGTADGLTVVWNDNAAGTNGGGWPQVKLWALPDEDATRGPLEKFVATEAAKKVVAVTDGKTQLYTAYDAAVTANAATAVQSLNPVHDFFYRWIVQDSPEDPTTQRKAVWDDDSQRCSHVNYGKTAAMRLGNQVATNDIEASYKVFGPDLRAQSCVGQANGGLQETAGNARVIDQDCSSDAARSQTLTPTRKGAYKVFAVWSDGCDHKPTATMTVTAVCNSKPGIRLFTLTDDIAEQDVGGGETLTKTARYYPGGKPRVSIGATDWEYKTLSTNADDPKATQDVPVVTWSRVGYTDPASAGFKDITWTFSSLDTVPTEDNAPGLFYQSYLQNERSTAEDNDVLVYTFTLTNGDGVEQEVKLGAGTARKSPSATVQGGAPNVVPSFTFPKESIVAGVYSWQLTVTDGCETITGITGTFKAFCDTDPGMPLDKDTRSGDDATELLWLSKAEKFGVETTVSRWYVSKRSPGSSDACPSTFDALVQRNDGGNDGFITSVNTPASLENQQTMTSMSASDMIQHLDGIPEALVATSSRSLQFTYAVSSDNRVAAASLGSVVVGTETTNAKLDKFQSGVTTISSGITSDKLRAGGAPNVDDNTGADDSASYLLGESTFVETNPGAVTYYETAEFFAYRAAGAGNTDGGAFKVAPIYGTADGAKYTITLTVTDGCRTKKWTRAVTAKCHKLTDISPRDATAASQWAPDQGFLHGHQGMFGKVPLAANSAGYKGVSGELEYRWKFVAAPAASVWNLEGIYRAYGKAYLKANQPAGSTIGDVRIMNQAFSSKAKTTIAASQVNAFVKSTTVREQVLVGDGTAVASGTLTGYAKQAVLVSDSPSGEVTWFRPDVTGTYELELSVSDGCSTQVVGATTVTASCILAEPTVSVVMPAYVGERGFDTRIELTADVGQFPGLAQEKTPQHGLLNYTWTITQVFDTPATEDQTYRSTDIAETLHVSDPFNSKASFTPTAVGKYSAVVCVNIAGADGKGTSCGAPACEEQCSVAKVIDVTCAKAAQNNEVLASVPKYYIGTDDEFSESAMDFQSNDKTNSPLWRGLVEYKGTHVTSLKTTATGLGATFPAVQLEGTGSSCFRHEWSLTSFQCAAPYVLSVDSVSSAPCYGGDVTVTGTGFLPAGLISGAEGTGSVENVIVKVLHKNKDGVSYAHGFDDLTNAKELKPSGIMARDWSVKRRYDVGDIVRIPHMCFKAQPRADVGDAGGADMQTTADLENMLYERWRPVPCPADFGDAGESSLARPPAFSDVRGDGDSDGDAFGKYDGRQKDPENRTQDFYSHQMGTGYHLVTGTHTKYPVGSVVMLDQPYCIKANKANINIPPFVVNTKEGVMSGYTPDQVTTNRWDVWTTPKPCVLKANRAYQEDAANKPAAATSWSRCKVKSLADDGNSLVCEMPPLRVDHASYTDEHYDMVSQELYIEVEVLGHRAISTTGIFSYESGLKIDSVEPRHGPTVGGGVLTIKGHNFRHIEYGPRADKPLGGEAEWDGDYVAARFTPFRVTVGDQPCPIMSQSETEIKCVTPPGYGTSHAVKLVVPGVDIVINQQFNAGGMDSLTEQLEAKKVYNYENAFTCVGNAGATEAICTGAGGVWTPNVVTYVDAETVDQSTAQGAGTMHDGELKRAARFCAGRNLYRATPCGIFTCGCKRDFRNMKRPRSVLMEHTYTYDPPVLVEVGRTYQALAGSQGGSQYPEVLASNNGEMGAPHRGVGEARNGHKSLTFSQQAEGRPTGGEWIEIAARNVPPYAALTGPGGLISNGKFVIYFGRLFNWHEGYAGRDTANYATDTVAFGAGNGAGGSFTFDGTKTARLNEQKTVPTGGLELFKNLAQGKAANAAPEGVELFGHGGTIKGFGTVDRRACQKDDLVLLERETAERPARFMCLTPPGCDQVQVNIHLSARTQPANDVPCYGQSIEQVSCQDVKFKYLEPYICDWYEPSCGTIALVGRNMPGLTAGFDGAALDAEVVMQEYDHYTGVWTDRARCGNLKKASEASVAQDLTFKEYNENTKEVLNDGWGDTRPTQTAPVLADETAATNKIADAVDHITNWRKTGIFGNAVDAANVLRPDFTCRLPSVFWPRNAVLTFDSPVHQKFRFKVRGCFLHEPAFYSASGEQRTCMDFEDTNEHGKNSGRGYSMATIDTDGIVTETVDFHPIEVGTTRVVLADMTVIGAAGSYYDAAQFGKPQRAAVLRAVSEASGLGPQSVLIESTTQDGKATKVQIAFVTNNNNVVQLIADAKGAEAAAVAALNAVAQGDAAKTVSSVAFSNVRDMLQYSGAKKVLSSSVVLTGVDAAKVIGSPTFREALQSVIATKVGVDKLAVQVTTIEEFTSGRRLGGVAVPERFLAGFNSVKVSFTVVTDADTSSAVSTEDIAAAMQAVTNDGSLVDAVNTETALSFTEAQIVGGGLPSKKVLGLDYQTAFVICLVIMILLFVVVLVLLVKVVQSPKGAPTASSAGDIQMQEAKAASN